MVVDSVGWDGGGPEPAMAAMIVRAVRITMDYETGRYVQEFQAHLTLEGQLIGTTGWMEHGSWTYAWIDGGFAFAPDGGTVEFSGWAGGPGEIVVHQRVRKAPRHHRFTYVFREQPSFR